MDLLFYGKLIQGTRIVTVIDFIKTPWLYFYFIGVDIGVNPYRRGQSYGIGWQQNVSAFILSRLL